MSFGEDLDESLEKCMQFDTLDDTIEIKLKDDERKKIGHSILKWLNENSIRSISSVDDFFGFLSELIEIDIVRDGRLTFKSSTRSDQEIAFLLRKNRDFFNSLIKQSEEKIEEEYQKNYLSETEEMLMLRWINTEKQINEAMKNVNKAINRFSYSRKRYRFARRFIENLYDFIDSIILLLLRWIEIAGNKGTEKEKLSLELLEWDINLFRNIYHNILKISQFSTKDSEETTEEKRLLAEVIVNLMR
ncbi:MAG: hypothetical protein ACTSSG_12435 [Candidatus Heimdallarchaeaceae archaeon]